MISVATVTGLTVNLDQGNLVSGMLNVVKFHVFPPSGVDIFPPTAL